MVGGLIPAFWPQYTKAGLFMVALGNGLIGLAARDNNVTSEQAGASKQTLPQNVLK